MTTRLIPRRRRSDGAGGGRIGLVIALAVVALAGHVLYKYVPVRIANAEYADVVEDTGREFSLQNITYEQLIEQLVVEAGRRDFDVSEQEITVDTDSKKEVEITVEHEVVLDMVWGDWPQSFTITKTIPRF